MSFTLDLPQPMSVNDTRRINWRAKPRIDAWVRSADALVLSQGKLPQRIGGRYKLTVVLSESSRLDCDNALKQPIDYLRRLNLVSNDSPRYLREITIKFGDAPEGCRLTVEAI